MPNPILTITFGQGLPSSSGLGITSVLSGATLATNSNVVFPDGTYNATVTVVLFGSPITYSLVFTGAHGVLTVTGGPLPLTLGSGAVISVYDRGVVPPGFLAPTPTATPTSSPSAGGTSPPSATPAPTTTPSATPAPIGTPTPSPTPAPAGVPADGTKIGSATTTINGLPSDLYGNGVVTTSDIVYYSSTPQWSVWGYPGTTAYAISNALNVASYRVDGCTGRIGYAGSGKTGVFTVPYVTLTFSDECAVELFSQPAAVVNADPTVLAVFYIDGPVARAHAVGTAVDLSRARAVH